MSLSWVLMALLVVVLTMMFGRGAMWFGAVSCASAALVWLILGILDLRRFYYRTNTDVRQASEKLTYPGTVRKRYMSYDRVQQVFVRGSGY